MLSVVPFLHTLGFGDQPTKMSYVQSHHSPSYSSGDFFYIF